MTDNLNKPLEDKLNLASDMNLFIDTSAFLIDKSHMQLDKNIINKSYSRLDKLHDLKNWKVTDEVIQEITIARDRTDHMLRNLNNYNPMTGEYSYYLRELTNLVSEDDSHNLSKNFPLALKEAKEKIIPPVKKVFSVYNGNQNELETDTNLIVMSLLYAKAHPHKEFFLWSRDGPMKDTYRTISRFMKLENTGILYAYSGPILCKDHHRVL